MNQEQSFPPFKTMTEGQSGGEATTGVDDDALIDPMDESMDAVLGADMGGFATPKKGLRQGTLLLLLVLAVASGTLWAMRKTGTVPGADTAIQAAEEKIEQALARLRGTDLANPAIDPKQLETLFGDTDQVIAMFVVDPTQNQVPIENIQKNPFALTLLTPNAEAEDGSADPALDRANEQRFRHLRAELKGMKLQSVMTSNHTPMALIDNKVVRPGDEIGSFKVVGIDSEAVRLRADGKNFTLTMERAQATLR